MLKVYASYGAMYPTQELTINTIADGVGFGVNQDGENCRVEMATIRASRTESGSPIGIYFSEMDAY